MQILKYILTAGLLSSAISNGASTVIGETSFNFYAEHSDGSWGDGITAYVGSFGIAPDSETSFNDVFDLNANNFTRFDSSNKFTSDSDGYLGENTTFNDAAAIGDQIYVLLMDVDSFDQKGTASEYAILTDSSWTFNDADLGQQQFITLDINLLVDDNSANNNFIIGSKDSVLITEPDGIFPSSTPFNTVQLADVIPEPSSVALLGLGSVALLLRRRR